MRRVILALGAAGLLGFATASARAEESITGPTPYTPFSTTVVNETGVTPVRWYVGPYWGGYTTYYPGYYYAPGYYYSYPSFVYPGPVYRPYVYPWRAYRFGRVWW